MYHLSVSCDQKKKANKQKVKSAARKESLKDVKAEAGRQAVADALLHLLNTTLKATAVSCKLLPGAVPLLVAAGVELFHLLHERHLHPNTQRQGFNVCLILGQA